MSAQINFENCLTFINWQWQGGTERFTAAEAVTRNAVTISREAGSGAHTIAEKLAARLQAHASPSARPWTVFDRNLIEQVLEDHHLPARLARHVSEDRTSQFEDIVNELFDIRPPSWELVQQTAETMLRLAHLGKVILIGRGANLVTGRLPNVLHVRLVAPIEQRIAHMQELRKLDRKAATASVRREDRERARYLKKYFKADAENPLLYHLVINTGLVGYDGAVEVIANALKNKSAQA
jgi:cytidylate kinase